MKKMFMLLLTVGLLLVSCKKETVAPQQQTVQQSADGKKPKPEVQEKAWNYATQTWATAYLTAGSTGWIKCYSDYGTNYSSKRAIITVSNNGSSDGSITVTVQRTSGCVNNVLGQELQFDVPKGSQVSKHVLITGYTDPQLRVQIKSSNSSFGNYSGLITYGYEY